MSMMIDRIVKRTVLVCAVFAAMAFAHNHVTQPCPDHGVGGMCVSAQVGGAR